MGGGWLTMSGRQSTEYREGRIGGNDQEAFATTVQVGSDKDLNKAMAVGKMRKGRVQTSQLQTQQDC